MFFWRPKERKAPAHGTYQSVVALFESCLRATFLSHFQPCHESLLVCFLGAVELSRLAALYASNQRSYSPRTISKKQTAFRCATYGAGFVYKLLLLWFLLTFTISFSYSVNNSLSGVLPDCCALSF